MRYLLLSSVIFAGCATYNHASNIKTVSFSDNVAKGQPAGTIRGEDCTWSILGYKTGSPPTLDRAVMNAQNQTEGGSLVSGTGLSKTDKGTGPLRYMSNMSAKPDGFNAGIIGKECIVVTGLGFR